jgi:acyl-CoA dehydrogenase
MYGFTPTDEQKMLLDTVTRYAKNDLRAAGHDAEEAKSLPKKLISKGWELGILQASTPEAYGGFGERNAVTGVLAVEELAFGDLAGALAVLAPSSFVAPILLAGSEEQKQKWIPPVIEADWTPFTAALIEPVFDFDPNAPQTSAVKEGDFYILTGAKTLVPFAAEAQAMIVYAALEGQTKAFIVEPGDGVVVSEREKFMGLNALPLYGVKFEGVKVPASHLLEGDFAPILAAMRVTHAALAVGVAKASFEYARDYAKERDAFGVKIAQKQAIAFMLAEMAMEIEAMRLLTWQAAWKLDTGKEDAFTEAYLAATGAADMVMMVTDRGVQILGGHGYIRDHAVEKFMREGRGFASFTGLAVV